MRWTLTRAAVLGLCLGQTTAIHVAEGSQCTSLCGNVQDSITTEDVVCKEDVYASSAAGIVFQQCTTCELGSTYVSGQETDLQWLLYNLRYAVSYCLFGEPPNKDVTSSPCLTRTACEPLKLAITYDDLAPNATALGYCQTWIHDQMPKCAACLRAGGEHYLTNFMTVLDGACSQMTAPGRTVSVDGSPFSKTQLNVTDPTPVATDLPNYYPGPLSLDQRVGIAFAGIAVLLFISGFCIICRGRKKRRTFLKEMETKLKKGPAVWPARINTNPSPAMGSSPYFDSPGMQQPFRGWDDTPLSQKPIRDWDSSPQSTHAEKFNGRYFSPYSSQYNSPDTTLEARNVAWPADKQPQGMPREIGLAFSGSEPSPVWDDSKGTGGVVEESYELREVDRYPGEVKGTPVHVIHPPSKPVYAHYYPEDYMDSPEEDFNRPKGW